MKKGSAGLALWMVITLLGCNMIGHKDDVMVRIGDNSLLRSEYDFAVKSVASDRILEPDMRNRIFSNLFDARLNAEIARRYAPSATKTVEDQLAALKERDLVMIFQRYYLSQNLGHTDDQLQEWFRSNEKALVTDTLHRSFEDLRDTVVRRMTLAEQADHVTEYFNKEKARFRAEDSAEIGLLMTRDSVKLAHGIEALTKGASFESVAMTINTDSALVASKGHLGTYTANKLPPLMAVFSNRNVSKLIFGRDTRVPVKTASHIIGGVNLQTGDTNRIYMSAYAFSYQDAPEPEYNKVRPLVEKTFIDNFRSQLTSGIVDSLKKKYKVEMVPVPPPDPKAYYEANKKEFMTQPMYRLLHLESSDSLKLVELLVGVRDEAAFRAKITQSENKSSRSHGGELLAKVGHCLPDSIGMMPDMFAYLQATPEKGIITPIFKAPDTKKYDVFYVLEVIPSEVKTYDRVEADVKARIRQNGDVAVDSSFTLVKVDGVPVIHESDVLRLRKEVPEQDRFKYPREKLLGFLLDWHLQARMAREVNMDESEPYKALMALRAADQWAAVYRDSVQNKTLAYSQAALQKVFNENPGHLFDGRKFEFAQFDAALWLDIPDLEYQREFLIHPERYPNAASWTVAKPQIFATIKNSEVRGAQTRLRFRMYRELNCEILDTTFRSFALPTNPQEMLKKAKEIYDARKLSDARAIYQQVRDVFPTDSSANQATLMIAQTYNEEENYQQALDEYTTLYGVWPNNADAYKAIFMKGFILSENLKNETLALQAFQEMLQRFPKSDLSDDATFMVKNIQSGGKLADALLDSISRQDSIPKK